MRNEGLKNKLPADGKFIIRILSIAFPIMIQNGISNFVGLLDNVMIGRVGTEQMSGVSIVNQLLFVFMLCTFGAVSGAGILGAQFYGQKKMTGVRDVLRIKLILVSAALLIALAVFITRDTAIISLYLHEGSETGDLAATLVYGKEYLKLMLIGLPPMAVEMSYSSTLRESGETKVPMIASVVAVLVNLVLNYILIFGKFGFPVLGVRGAAIATVISRYIQAVYVVGWSCRHADTNTYMDGVFRDFRVSWSMFSKILFMALPLILNETLWAAGVAAVNTCYSYRGLSAVAATNIETTLYNVSNIMYIAMGDAIAITVGQLLGAGKIEEARKSSAKIIAMALCFSIIGGLIMFGISDLFPLVYNTSDEVRELSGKLIRVAAVFMPMHAFLHAVYFTIRSGGKTVVTFLFDSAYLWAVDFPLAYFLSHFTAIPIIPLFAACQAVELIKVAVGFTIYRSGVWARNITQDYKKRT